MATFYFHIMDGAESTPDIIGVELLDIVEARTEATVLAGELLRDRPHHFWSARAWTMTVQDEAGTDLFTIRIAATPVAGAGADQAARR